MKYFEFLKNLENNLDDFDNARIRDKALQMSYIKKKKFNKDLVLEGNASEYAPDFYTLNKNVQLEFVNLLEKLKITPDVANYAKYLALNRERREFIGWLYKILGFLEEESKNTNI